MNIDLSGIWSFCVDDGEVGEIQKWYQSSLPSSELMPVPASYNDITQNRALRDLVGVVWYQNMVTPSQHWKGYDIVLHFGAVAHHATVFINDIKVAHHKGGFLPFEVDITHLVSIEEAFRLSVKVDNRLDWSCLPPGEIKTITSPDGSKQLQKQTIHFDFFNYAGIHRPVQIQLLPKTRLQTVLVHSELSSKKSGLLKYTAILHGDAELEMDIVDEEGIIVARQKGSEVSCSLDNITPWAPGKPYLYTLVFKIFKNGVLVDHYPITVGFRSVLISNDQFLINHEPFYFKGFGKHEDSTLHGRGFDPVTLVKDMKLMAWIGANSFRTSHYPYAEEVLDVCDRLGIVVIDECPAVGLWDHSAPVFGCGKVNHETLQYHCDVMTDLIHRDQHHPCIVMWSIANEPAAWEKECRPYFEIIVQHTRTQDSYLPLCCVVNSDSKTDLIQDLFDVTTLNRYPGWYYDFGKIELIEENLIKDLTAMHDKYGKPIIITEYGADTISGFHAEPSLMFSEEYQCEFLDAYHKAYDRLPFVVGEHVWNFADFATKQGITRPMGNKKGVFTRDRQPKASAHLMRKRWHNSLSP